MPNIQEYTAPDLNLHPNDAAVQGAVQAGRRLGTFAQEEGSAIGGTIKQLGDAYVEHQTQQEISQGYTMLAATDNDLNQRLEDAAKDPANLNNPTFVQDQVAQARDQLDQAQTHFKTPGGNTFAQAHTASMLENFTRKAIALRSDLAGDAVIQNGKDATNQYSAMSFRDQASLDNALAASDAGWSASVQAHPGLDAQTASKVNTELSAASRAQIITSGIMGAGGGYTTGQQALADGDPDWHAKGVAAVRSTQALINSGKYDNEIGDKKDLLLREGDERIKALDEDQRSVATATTKAQKEQVQSSLVSLYTKGIQDNGTWAPPAGYASALRNIAVTAPPGSLDRADIEAMTGAAKTATEEAASGVLVQDTKPVSNAMFQRATLPATDPNVLTVRQVDQAYGAGQLSNKTYQVLRQAADDARSGKKDPQQVELERQLDEHLANIKHVFTSASDDGASDPKGWQMYNQYEYDLRNAAQAAMSTNHQTAQQVGEFLTDPRSPGYFGKNIPRYYNAAGLAVGTAGGEAPGSLIAPARGVPGVAPVRSPNGLPGSNLTPDQQAFMNDWNRKHPNGQ